MPPKDYIEMNSENFKLLTGYDLPSIGEIMKMDFSHLFSGRPLNQPHQAPTINNNQKGI